MKTFPVKLTLRLQIMLRRTLMWLQRKPALLILFLLAVVVFTAGSLAANVYLQISLITLQSSASSFTQTSLIEAIVASPDSQKYYTVDREGRVAIYDKDLNLSKAYFTQTKGPLAVGPQGHLYFLDSPSKLRVMNPAGVTYVAFSILPPVSLGVLKNGNIVVAAPVNEKLFHIYSQTGRPLKNFGEIKLFDANNKQQNKLLNTGKILVSSSDEIYYVYKYAPIIQKYSGQGQLIAEYSVEGTAISLQLEALNRFLSKKRTEEIGGITVINSADLDPQTGHLWLCMNGSSRSGVVYEYDSNGIKLREYALIFAASTTTPLIITNVWDIVVRNQFMYILTTQGWVCRFDLGNRPSTGFIPSVRQLIRAGRWGLIANTLLATATRGLTLKLAPQLPCSPTVTIPDCTYNCPPNQGGSKDCKAALQTSIGENLPKVAPTGCNFHPAGSANPFQYGGCSAQVTTCNPTNGDRVTAQFIEYSSDR